jgi:ferredoxin
VESPHDVLGVDRDADERAVVAAYRRRVKEAHPDHGGSQAEFQRVKEAYEAIVDGRVDPDGDEGVPAGPARRAERPGRAGPEPDEERTATRVEYVDYQALSDHDWDLDDADLFERVSDAELDPGEGGRFLNDPDDTLLEAAEDCGFTWPYSCRGGACANCAVALLDGEMEMPANHVLPDELYDQGIRLSCIGRPTTEEAKVVYNLKYLPELQELLLPGRPF